MEFIVTVVITTSEKGLCFIITSRIYTTWTPPHESFLSKVFNHTTIPIASGVAMSRREILRGNSSTLSVTGTITHVIFVTYFSGGVPHVGRNHGRTSAECTAVLGCGSNTHSQYRVCGYIYIALIR